MSWAPEIQKSSCETLGWSQVMKHLAEVGCIIICSCFFSPYQFLKGFLHIPFIIRNLASFLRSHIVFTVGQCGMYVCILYGNKLLANSFNFLWIEYISFFFFLIRFSKICLSAVVEGSLTEWQEHWLVSLGRAIIDGMACSANFPASLTYWPRQYHNSKI